MSLLAPFVPHSLKAARRTRLEARREQAERERQERFWRDAPDYVSRLGLTDRFGNHFLVDPRDAVLGRYLFFDKVFDAAGVMAVADALNGRGYVPSRLVEVGANVGTTTVQFLQRYPGVRVVAFEPVSKNVTLLRQNLLWNAVFDRVDVRAVAVDDVTGSATLELSPTNGGDNRLRETDEPGDYGEETWDTTSVDAVRLDDMVDSGVIDPSERGLLWIDAQGREAHILAGAATLRHWPAVVEFWPYGLNRNRSYQSFLEAVGEYGGVFEIDRLDQSSGEVGVSLTGHALAELGDELASRPSPESFTDLLLWPRELS